MIPLSPLVFWCLVLAAGFVSGGYAVWRWAQLAAQERERLSDAPIITEIGR